MSSTAASERELALRMQLASLNSSDLGTRMAAESALKAGEAGAVAALIGLLEDAAQPEEVRWRAAIILGDIGAYEAVSPLLAAAGDACWEIRHSAIYALGHLRAAVAFDVLCQQVMRAAGDEQIPYVAGLGLMQIDPERARALLEAAAHDPEPAVCAVARSVLASVAARQT